MARYCSQVLHDMMGWESRCEGRRGEEKGFNPGRREADLILKGNLNGTHMRASKQGSVWKRRKETTIRVKSLSSRRESTRSRLSVTLCYFSSQTASVFCIFLLTNGLPFISSLLVCFFCPLVYVIDIRFFRITLPTDEGLACSTRT